MAGRLGGWMARAPPTPTPSPPLTGTGPLQNKNVGSNAVVSFVTTKSHPSPPMLHTVFFV